MRQPSHSDPNNHCDHPIDFGQRHEWDYYLNPWWALRFLNGEAEVLTNELTKSLGRPYLLNDPQWVNRLEWPGPTTPGFGNRPQIMANISGGNGSIWTTIYLPWATISLRDIQAGWHPDALGHHLAGVPLDFHLEQLKKFARGLIVNKSKCDVSHPHLPKASVLKGIRDIAATFPQRDNTWNLFKSSGMDLWGFLRPSPVSDEEVVP